MKLGNTTLIPQNVAPPKAKRVAVCDGDKVMLTCELGHLAMPPLGEKRYSAGLLSDTHIITTDNGEYTAADAQNDLARAVAYFSEVADITCICGDLVSYNSDECLGKYKEIVDANKGDMSVYAIAGNHEHQAYPSGTATMGDEIREYTGHPLRYLIEHNGDVFIMCGAVSWGAVFDQAGIQWLYEALEANRNKRCFLFVHGFLKGAQYCGDSAGIVNTVDMTAAYKQVFISLLNHYKNVICFHGHSHVMCEMQEHLYPLPANYDNACGVHSVHIPALAYPRDISSGERVEMVGESQGYLMDVYDNHIVLRGMDFVKGEFIPIATYCLDTALQTVEAGTFTDSTCTITI